MRSKKYSKEINQLLNFIKKECKKNNVKLILEPKKEVDCNGIKCSGYFSSDSQEIHVATKKTDSQWIEVLIHEFCHSQQWIEGGKIWKNTEVLGFDSGSILDLWLNKVVELSKKQLDKYIDSIIENEKDCEMRTVKMIEKFNLSINIAEYIRKSNAYVLSYHIVKKHRIWRKRPPYMVPEIVREMPGSFNINYKNPNPQLLKLIKNKSF